MRVPTANRTAHARAPDPHPFYQVRGSCETKPTGPVLRLSDAIPARPLGRRSTGAQYLGEVWGGAVLSWRGVLTSYLLL